MTHPESQAERYAFEAWAAENQFDIRRPNKSYLNTCTDYAWLGWQAGRAALPPVAAVWGTSPIDSPEYQAAQAGKNQEARARLDAIAGPVAAVPDWISVDDLLPEDNQVVIILFWPFDNRENAQIVGQAEHYDGVFLTDDGEDHHFPSHWMPRPPLPVVPSCTCPSGDGSLRWPCPVHPAAHTTQGE